MTLRIVQIGSGGWGSSWLKFIHETEGCELVGLVSRGGANLEQAQKTWQLKDSRCFTELDKGLAVDADLVIVAVPHHLHIDMAERVVRAGKNVLIEKPMSDSFERAKGFATFMEGREERAWVSQNFRFRPELWKIKASFGDNGAGNPLWIDIRFRMGANTKVLPAWRQKGWRQTQWSFLMKEITTHHFDMLRFLLGVEPVTVVCRGWNPPWGLSEGPEVLYAWFEFDGGIQVDYMGATEGLGQSTGWQAYWFVQTDQGSILWEGDTLEMQASKDDQPMLVEPAGFPGFDREGVLCELMKAMQGQACAVPTVADNVKSMALIYAAELSVREGREVRVAELL